MKELIILYAPTVLTVVSAFAAFVKVGKDLKSQKQAVVDSVEMKDLRKQMKAMCTEISCLRRQLSEANHDQDNQEVQE